MNSFEPLEKIWDDLLSRDRDRVLAAFEKLDPKSRKNIIVHLKGMVSEKGWHKEQKLSAEFALSILRLK
jgi:hypothetical protein